MFQFLASTDAAKTYTFKVRQTYSDGTVVDWIGPGVLGHAGSVDRGEVVARRRREQHARDRRARRSARSRSSPQRSRGLFAVGEARAGMTRGARLALVVVAVAARLRCPRPPGRTRSLVRTAPVGELRRQPAAARRSADLSEAVEPRFAIVSVTNAAGQQQTAGAPRRSATDADDARRAAQPPFPGLVPRLLAGDLGRRPSGSRRVHVRCRPKPRAGTAVSGSLDLGDRRDAAAGHGPRNRVPVDHGRDRPLLPAGRDRASGRAARVGDAPSRGLDRLRDRCVDRLDRDSRLRRDGDGRNSRCVRPSTWGTSCRSCETRRSAGAFSISSSRSGSSCWQRRSRSGSTGPSARNDRSPSCSRARAPCSPPVRRCWSRGFRVTRPSRLRED